MRAWIDAALSILFAPTCAACDRPLTSPSTGTVCTVCWESIVPVPFPRCEGCGDPLSSRVEPLAYCLRCRIAPRLIDCTRALGIYDGSLRSIIHAWKYAGRRSIAEPLAALLRERETEILRMTVAAVPVPLHGARVRKRGFNQASDLAKGLGLPVVEALRRIRATATQADLSADERAANVANAFAATRP